jgi:hypothetical protein
MNKTINLPNTHLKLVRTLTGKGFALYDLSEYLYSVFEGDVVPVIENGQTVRWNFVGEHAPPGGIPTFYAFGSEPTLLLAVRTLLAAYADFASRNL